MKTMLYYFVYVLLMCSCAHGCLSGTYRNNGTCQDCEKGFYCPNKNMTLPYPCPLGQYSDMNGAINCSMCPAGFYCNTTNTSPVKCALGYYSTSGMSLCIPCKAGFRWGYYFISLIIS